MNNRPKLTKTFLKKEYITKDKNKEQIAKETGYGYSTIIKWLKIYGLNSKPRKKRIQPQINIGPRGNYLVLAPARRHDSRYKNYWLCQCKCGNVLEIQAYAIERQTFCKKCKSDNLSKRRASFFEEISLTVWGRIRSCAKTRKIKFEISIEDGWNLFLKQNRKCALSGMELSFSKRNELKSNTTASLDRIDSSKDYTIDNIQWVHKDINRMKSSFTQEYFLSLVSKIAINTQQL